jgi:hypothetical protein
MEIEIGDTAMTGPPSRRLRVTWRANANKFNLINDRRREAAFVGT